MRHLIIVNLLKSILNNFNNAATLARIDYLRLSSDDFEIESHKAWDSSNGFGQ